MGETGMHKVLVSACLLGQPVRYDGQSKGIVSDWLQALGAEGRALAFCPEVAGGLPTPRPPAERQGERVVTESGLDVTEEFDNGRFEGVSLAGEGKTTALLRRHGIAVFSEDQLPELASALALAACGSV